MRDILQKAKVETSVNKRGSIATGVRTSARIARAEESFRTAAEALGRLEKGVHVFAITRGQWSMIDAILAVLDQTGPAHVSCWTWTVAEYELQCMERLMFDEKLLSARLVIDLSGRSTNKKHFENLLGRWQKRFGLDSVRYVVNHAKIATVWNDDWRFLLRGSMNLNFNPRFENFDLSEGCAGFDLVRSIEDELPLLPDTCSHEDAKAAAKVGDAFDAAQLAIFKPLKIWAR
jgi:hypothetical protein